MIPYLLFGMALGSLATIAILIIIISLLDESETDFEVVNMEELNALDHRGPQGSNPESCNPAATPAQTTGQPNAGAVVETFNKTA
jgi:hypothetical protein